MNQQLGNHLNSNTVLSIPNVFYHRLSHNDKEILQSGPLDICFLQGQQNSALSAQIGHYILSITNEYTIVKCEYQTLITYYLVFEPEGSITSLTLDKGNINDINLQEYLKQTTKLISVVDLPIDNRVKGIIETHWREYLVKPPISGDIFQRMISMTGHSVGQGIVKVGSKISEYWNRNKGLPEVREEPSWFDTIKEKTSSILKQTGAVVGGMVSPLVAKGKEVKNSINNKIDQGNSDTLKYMKDIAEISTEAVSNILYGTKAAVTGKDEFYTHQEFPEEHRQPVQYNVPQDINESSADLVEREGIRQELLKKPST